MAILVDADTKVVVSGLTGREGTFHALRNRQTADTPAGAGGIFPAENQAGRRR